MERIEVERLSPGIVRLPGRQFPGTVIQGDSLSVLRAEVAEIGAACAAGDQAAAQEAASLLLNKLDALLADYEDALARHGIQRPY